jgi:hypothetical protein
MTIHNDIKQIDEDEHLMLFKDNPDTGDNDFIGIIENFAALEDVIVQAVFDTDSKYLLSYKKRFFYIDKIGAIVSCLNDGFQPNFFGLYDFQLEAIVDKVIGNLKFTSYDDYLKEAEKEGFKHSC